MCLKQFCTSPNIERSVLRRRATRCNLSDMRILGRVRISRASEESTSIERQRALIESWAANEGHEIVGWAEDIDVSGSVDPFDAPELGQWLTDEKKHDWDAIVAWKLDRITRRAIPMGKLFGWLQDNGKTLICTADSINLTTPMGRLIAYVIATIAEGELEAIRERTKASHKKLRELGRWPGGKPAYGYRAQEREDAAGWELVEDPTNAERMRWIVSKVIEGRSVESIAKELTDTGVPSPSGNGKWHGQTIRQQLRSKTLLGHVTHNRVTIRDDEGNPVRKGPALISTKEYDRLQSALESNSFRVTRASGTSFSGVVVCAVCYGPLHHRGQTTDGKLYRYYYCRKCGGPSVHADEVEEAVERALLAEIGDKCVLERVYDPGDDQNDALRDAERAVEDISAALVGSQSRTVVEALTRQLSALDSRIKELEATPAREAGWQYEETDKTYREAWESADKEQRRQLLVKSGITAAVRMKKKHEPSSSDTPDFHLRIPDDVLARMA